MVKQKNEKTVNAQNNKDESYSSDISLKYSARKVVSCPSINFSFKFLERQLFWEFNRRPHNLGAEYFSGHYTDSIATPCFLECHLDSKYRPYCHFCKSCINAQT